MSHVVLARKYRPRSFEQMVGQTHVVQALTNALTSGRLHHAYLFTGTRGIGKTTVSRILAKSLNCTGADGTGGVTARPCGVCAACTEIDADRFIDYIELDAASNRGIDEVRDLIERATYKPSIGRYKVFMIDEAHQLTKEAFNALLKTLEEPPDYLKFVLATTDPEKMLPTVLSRCLQFNLRPMAPEVVHEHLAQVLAAEGVATDAGALRLLSRAARGSMRDALSLTDQAIAYGAGSLAEDGVRAMLGTVDRSHAAKLVQALAGRDGAGVLATVDALRQLGLSPAGTLEEMAALLQQMAVEQAVPGALDDTDPDTAGARALAADLAPDETQLLYSIVVHGRVELNLLSDEYAALTMVLLRLLAFPPAGGAAAATAAPRAASLVATPREARSTAPARPTAARLPLTPLPPGAATPLATLTTLTTMPTPTATPALITRPTPTPMPMPMPDAQIDSPLAADRAVFISVLPVPPAAIVLSVQTPAATLAAAPAATPVASPAKAPTATSAARFSPPPPARALSVQEPPPWLDEELPDETLVADGLAAGSADPVDADDVLRSGLAGHLQDDRTPARQPDHTSISPISPISPPTRPAPTAPALPQLQTTLLGDQWAAVIRPLVAAGGVAALVRELALQAQLLAVTPLATGGRGWRLAVERETLRNPPLVAKLTAALQDALGEPVQLEVVAGVPQDSIARRDTATREAAQQAAEQLIQNDPVVRALMAQFRTARIVPGSIKPLAADGGEPKAPTS